MAKEELRVSCAVGILRAMQVLPYARTIAAFVRRNVRRMETYEFFDMEHLTNQIKAF